MKRGIYACFFKRFFDVLLSLLAIILLSPVLILVYLLSLIILRGNPIFKQYRPGKDGKIFAMYKFRSMTNKTDENGELLPDSERITGWGKFLRKTSIDELPQLFNILFGDMSIIGPRPRLIKDMIFYDAEIISSAYGIRPGLTGPAQVYDRNSESCWEDVFKRDIEYANNVTLLNDLKLFFGTFTALFKGGSSSGANTGKSKVQKREYYYGDYLLKSGQITEQEYNKNHKAALEMEHKGKGKIVPESQQNKNDADKVSSGNEVTLNGDSVKESSDELTSNEEDDAAMNEKNNSVHSEFETETTDEVVEKNTSKTQKKNNGVQSAQVKNIKLKKGKKETVSE